MAAIKVLEGKKSDSAEIGEQTTILHISLEASKGKVK